MRFALLKLISSIALSKECPAEKKPKKLYAGKSTVVKEVQV